MSKGAQNVVIGDVDDNHFRLAMVFNNDRLPTLGGTNDFARMARKLRFAGINHGVHPPTSSFLRKMYYVYFTLFSLIWEVNMLLNRMLWGGYAIGPSTPT